MEIVKTFIVEEKGHYMFDEEFIKLHLLRNGTYFVERLKGRLSPITKEYAEKLMVQ
jgi:hypothetical protein